MEIQSVKLVYFSPTGTTQKVLESIGKAFDVKESDHINMTLPRGIPQVAQSFRDELVIIGAPVYGGRLPADAITRFNQVKGKNSFAVLVVVYGNREYEDSLLELKNLAMELGFTPVAAAAFIGEHSFATKDAPIANGRPDKKDLQVAENFGRKIKEKLTTLQSSDDLREFYISGRYPYHANGAQPMTVAPVLKEDTCTMCGECVPVCPTEAISINEVLTTTIEKCIRCCACIKQCPVDARFWQDEMMNNFTNWLTQFFKYPKEPRIFGLEL